MAGHAGIWERLAQFAQSECARDASGIQIEFSTIRDCRAELVRKNLVKVLEELGCDCKTHHYIRFGSCRRFPIDDYASVILPGSCNELLFQLQMRVGPRVLLVTDEITVMSDFVSQYALARMHGNKDLRAIL